MNTREIRDALFKRLKHLGAIKWHNNRDSYYIKFKDVRVGSIRISKHTGRQRYSYTWQIDINDDAPYKIKEIEHQVTQKIETILDFDPNKYMVWDRGFKEVNSFEEYKDYILNKRK
jgi:transcription initiation factor IIE alpha subunit